MRRRRIERSLLRSPAPRTRPRPVPGPAPAPQASGSGGGGAAVGRRFQKVRRRLGGAGAGLGDLEGQPRPAWRVFVCGLPPARARQFGRPRPVLAFSDQP